MDTTSANGHISNGVAHTEQYASSYTYQLKRKSAASHLKDILKLLASDFKLFSVTEHSFGFRKSGIQSQF